MSQNQKVKVHTLDSALESARKYCAYQERSQKEVRDKLYLLGLHRDDVEQAIVQLIEENFVNEERFAITFARGKFRIKKWGKIKIAMALKMRDISAWCIKNAITQIDDEEYENTLRQILESTHLKIKEKNVIKKNFLVAKYAISRGFEPELVWHLIRNSNLNS